MGVAVLSRFKIAVNTSNRSLIDPQGHLRVPFHSVQRERRQSCKSQRVLLIVPSPQFAICAIRG